MIRYLRSTGRVFLHYRHLLMNLVSRDIKVKYRRSTLGLLWSVLNPLLMAGVMTFVFTNVFTQLLEVDPNAQVVSATGLPPAFIVYVLTGQLIFAFFSDSTNAAMDSVLGNAALIKKVYIPKYIFPLEKVVFGFVNAMFSLLALLFIIVITGSPLSSWALMFWYPMVLLFFFNLGVGMILSAAVVYFRDIKHLYSVFVLALTYMTPIFYPESIFEGNEFVKAVIRLNPLYWYVAMFRQLVVYGEAPTPAQLGVTAFCSVLALVVGLLIFRKSQDNFILYI